MIELRTITTSAPGGPPVDADALPAVAVLGRPAGEVGDVVRLAPGLYRAFWTPAEDVPAGEYVIAWTATIDGYASTGYDTVTIQTGNAADEFTREAVKSWLKIERADEDGILDRIVGAVESQIDALPAVPRTAAGLWTDAVQLAALMLAGRLYRRRNSPSGIEAFADGGATYVSRYDPDVARILGLDSFTRPAIG